MKMYKLNKLTDTFGTPDYKGLNINLFLAGSQVYKKDLSYCVVATSEETTVNHPDLTELSEGQYIIERQTIEAEINAEVITTEQKIAILETENAQLRQEVDTLALEIINLKGGTV